MIVVVLAAGVSGLEAVGALLIYLLLAMVTGASEALELPLIGDMQQALPAMPERDLMLGMAALVALFFVVRAAGVLASEYAAARVTENAGARLSKRLADGYLAMPYRFHLQRNSAELIRNAYGTVQELVLEVFRPLVKIVSEGLIVLALVGVLLLTAPLATALVVLAVVPAGYGLLRLVYPRLKRLGEERQRANSGTLQALQQSLEGFRDIKLLGREEYFGAEFARARDQAARVRYRRQVLTYVPGVGVETLIVVIIAFAFAAVLLVEGTAVGAIPVLGLFGYAGLRLKPSLTAMAQSVNSLRFSTAGIDDVHADVSLFKRTSGGRASDVEPLRFASEISLEKVTFTYEGGASPALREVDLRIRKGESIGIVGPTGGGKTTLIDILTGLLAPDRGSVLVDGVDIRGRERDWQENLGVVPQANFIIDDTLRRNISLGIPDDEVDCESLHRAIDMAQLRPVVEELAEGLDTVVGERGMRLSGGQRQRIAIARALYRDPEVLIFDEGTSALDSLTESYLLHALESLRSDYTLIAVAHRLATIRDCDRVLFIRGGRLAGDAPYDELYRANRHFRDMAAQARGPAK